MRLGIQAAIARELNITARHINDILAGRQRAGSKLAVRLEQLTGIDRAIWVWGTPEEVNNHQLKAGGMKIGGLNRRLKEKTSERWWF